MTPLTPGFANFAAVNTYTAGQFADVAASYWGAPNVAKAYELGLMKANKTSDIYSLKQSLFPGCAFSEDWWPFLLSELVKCKMIKGTSIFSVPSLSFL